MSRLPRFLLLSVCAALATGCEIADRVNRPLPETFAVQRLDGSRMEREAFHGRPWVLALWVPG
jgi:hypothetical protein